jgi:predicted transcriptional regulator
MENEITQEGLDSAILLENRIRERIREETNHILKELVASEVRKLFLDHKGVLLMEITTSINQMLRGFIDEKRKPLWESTPEELGLSRDDLNKHMLGKDIDRA